MDWIKAIRLTGIIRVLLMIAYLAGSVVFLLRGALLLHSSVRLVFGGPIWLLAPWAYSSKARSFWVIVSLIVSATSVAIGDCLVLIPALSRITPPSVLFGVGLLALVSALSAGVNQALANEAERRQRLADAATEAPRIA